MIIVDTSVWIDFLKKKLEEELIFIRLINNDEILIPDVVAAELLQGAKSKREVKIIKSYAQNLKKIDHEEIFIEAGEYSFNNKLIHKGVGLIDAVIIISAIRSNSKIWTKDLKLKSQLSKELVYIPSLY